MTKALYSIDEYASFTEEEYRLILKRIRERMPNQAKVLEFHKKHDAYIAEKGKVEHPPEEIINLRYNLLSEEVVEWRLAMGHKSITEIAKESADILYVLYGLAISYGFDLDVVFDEVHKSNMSKVVQGTGKTMKVMKGPGYQAPDLNEVIFGTGENRG